MVNMSYHRKKALKIYLVAALLLVCCVIFAACNSDNSYSVAGDTVSEPTHFMAKFIILINEALGGDATSFGWTVVLFTVVLRLILSPLDIWQKIIARKNAKAMERMKPQLDALQEKYGDDKQRMQQEQAALYKKEKYSTLGMCLPTIITLVVFFVVFAGFRQMVGYQYALDYKSSYNTYNQSISSQIENGYSYQDESGTTITVAGYGDTNGDGVFTIEDIAKDEAGKEFLTDIKLNAQQAVYDNYYKDENTTVRSFLWIKNIFVPDSWEEAVPDFATITGQSGMATSKLTGFTIDEYNDVMGMVLGTGGYGKDGKWNGLLILPILSVVLQFVSTKMAAIAQGEKKKKKTKEEKRAEKLAAQQNKSTNPQAQSMKSMQYMMPIMMGVFGLFYSGAFALYMFVSSATAIIFQLAFNIIGKLVDRSKEKKNNGLVAKR